MSSLWYDCIAYSCAANLCCGFLCFGFLCWPFSQCCSLRLSFCDSRLAMSSEVWLLVFFLFSCAQLVGHHITSSRGETCLKFCLSIGNSRFKACSQNAGENPDPHRFWSLWGNNNCVRKLRRSLASRSGRITPPHSSGLRSGNSNAVVVEWRQGRNESGDTATQLATSEVRFCLL